jgi:hypothetical protein
MPDTAASRKRQNQGRPISFIRNRRRQTNASFVSTSFFPKAGGNFWK